MRTAEQWLNQYKRLLDTDNSAYWVTEKDFKESIRNAQIEAIKECIKIVNQNSSMLSANDFITPKLKNLIDQVK